MTFGDRLKVEYKQYCLDRYCSAFPQQPLEAEDFWRLLAFEHRRLHSIGEYGGRILQVTEVRRNVQGLKVQSS